MLVRPANVGALLRLGPQPLSVYWSNPSRGAAGAVDDQAAAAFSSAFFAALAGNARLEDAVHEARVAALQAAPDTSTWAAYQAWGDPDFRLFPPAPAAE